MQTDLRGQHICFPESQTCSSSEGTSFHLLHKVSFQEKPSQNCIYLGSTKTEKCRQKDFIAQLRYSLRSRISFHGMKVLLCPCVSFPGTVLGASTFLIRNPETGDACQAAGIRKAFTKTRASKTHQKMPLLLSVAIAEKTSWLCVATVSMLVLIHPPQLLAVIDQSNNRLEHGLSH